MNIVIKTIFLLQMQNILFAQNLEDIDYVTEAVEVMEEVEDTTEVEEVVVVTTPVTTPLVQTTSAEPMIEDDLILTRSDSEADTVLLDPAADTDDNLELNSNNVIFTTQTSSGSGSDNSVTEDDVDTPKLAVEEDVDKAEADVGTPRLVAEDNVDNIEADSETPSLGVEKEVIEADIADVPEISAENVDTEELDVSVPKLLGGWFYFSKPGGSSLYQTVQTFPRWKSGYHQMPWLYPRQWPVRPLLTNEVGDESPGYKTKLSPSYPFYAFRKISHQ